MIDLDQLYRKGALLALATRDLHRERLVAVALEVVGVDVARRVVDIDHQDVIVRVHGRCAEPPLSVRRPSSSQCTTLRPLCLARYRARSAACTMASGQSPSSGKLARPTLMVLGDTASLEWRSRDITSSARSRSSASPRRWP